jgi:hypothetical protein
LPVAILNLDQPDAPTARSGSSNGTTSVEARCRTARHQPSGNGVSRDVFDAHASVLDIKPRATLPMAMLLWSERSTSRWSVGVVNSRPYSLQLNGVCNGVLIADVVLVT